MGGVHPRVRTCARAYVPLFRISETAGPIALKFGLWLETHQLGVLQKLMVGYRRTCAPLFRISGTAGRIALKLGVVRGPLAMHCTQHGGYPHERLVTVHTFKHICSLPFIHRPKGVLLVLKWQ